MTRLYHLLAAVCFGLFPHVLLQVLENEDHNKRCSALIAANTYLKVTLNKDFLLIILQRNPHSRLFMVPLTEEYINSVDGRVALFNRSQAAPFFGEYTGEDPSKPLQKKEETNGTKMIQFQMGNTIHKWNLVKKQVKLFEAASMKIKTKVPFEEYFVCEASKWPKKRRQEKTTTVKYFNDYPPANWTTKKGVSKVLVWLLVGMVTVAIVIIIVTVLFLTKGYKRSGSSLSRSNSGGVNLSRTSSRFGRGKSYYLSGISNSTKKSASVKASPSKTPTKKKKKNTPKLKSTLSDLPSILATSIDGSSSEETIPRIRIVDTELRNAPISLIKVRSQAPSSILKSDTPTALIAPSDYENFFDRRRDVPNGKTPKGKLPDHPKLNQHLKKKHVLPMHVSEDEGHFARRRPMNKPHPKHTRKGFVGFFENLDRLIESKDFVLVVFSILMVLFLCGLIIVPFCLFRKSNDRYEKRLSEHIERRKNRQYRNNVRCLRAGKKQQGMGSGSSNSGTVSSAGTSGSNMIADTPTKQSAAPSDTVTKSGESGSSASKQ